MATNVLGLHTFTASEPWDFNIVNDNSLKIDNGVKTAMQGRAAQNLLDNSDFRNPVNQRGQTSYNASGYTIDRWRTWDDGTVTINNGYISHETPIYQTIGVKLDTSKAYTLAVMNTNNVITLVSGFINNDLWGSGINLTYNNGDSYVRIYADDHVKNVVWAALYEGSYTADTLPAYVPKDNELAECQRQYFPVFQSETTYAYWTKADGDTCKIYIPSPKMRVNPTPVLYDGGCTVYIAGNSIWSNAVTLQYYGYAQGCNVFSFSSPSAYFETGKTYLYRGIKALSAEM